MALHEFNKNPTAKELKWFGLLLAAFFALVGGVIAWRAGSATVFYVVGGVGALLGAVFYGVPALRRPMYLGWMYLFFPVGFVVSLLLLAIVYYLVLTPIALLLRLAGKDPLARALDKGATSYWSARPPAPPKERYFKQY